MRMWVFSSALLLGGVVLTSIPESGAQPPLFAVQTPKPSKRARQIPIDKPSAEPAFAIPVTALGFAPPAPFYLGSRVAQLSLDFLDEDRLLFTFRVPGLIPREAPAPGQSPETQRHIRAVVLELPSGRVAAEALWTLHDIAPYLTVLKNGHFLLRDRNTVQMGDATLHLEPFLRFPGPVSYLELDPEQRFLVADTSEPPATGPASGSSANSALPANNTSQEARTTSANQNLLRILSMDTRSVQLFSRVPGAIHLPLDGEGYFEALRGRGANWVLTHQGFHGDAAPLCQFESTCTPSLDAVAPGVVLASACFSTGGRKLIAVSADRHPLWEIVQPATRVWPRLAVASNALRIARSTLETTHPIDAMSPVEGEDIRGQSVQVYDLADGKLLLNAPALPVLDGGGNFALSPSGLRFAILHAGEIQVFALPPVPDLPKTLPAANSAVKSSSSQIPSDASAKAPLPRMN